MPDQNKRRAFKPWLNGNELPREETNTEKSDSMELPSDRFWVAFLSIQTP
jgi:hypothetical protein